jgi:ureidoacrylate peracid hydrolase
MMKVAYNKQLTALLVIDPYNDFISDGGKLWDRLKGVAEANNCVPNMLQVLNAARKAELRVFYALHHRYRPGDYETWKYIAPVQKAACLRKSFEYGTCVEATVRYAAELGYEVTVVKDATASYSDEEMHAALDVNIPNYASAIVTTVEIVDSISSLSTVGISVGH